MTTASQTMVAQTLGYDRERRGLWGMAIGALVVILGLAALQWPPHALVDTSHEIQ